MPVNSFDLRKIFEGCPVEDDYMDSIDGQENFGRFTEVQESINNDKILVRKTQRAIERVLYYFEKTEDNAKIAAAYLLFLRSYYYTAKDPLNMGIFDENIDQVAFSDGIEYFIKSYITEEIWDELSNKITGDYELFQRVLLDYASVIKNGMSESLNNLLCELIYSYEPEREIAVIGDSLFEIFNTLSQYNYETIGDKFITGFFSNNKESVVNKIREIVLDRSELDGGMSSVTFRNPLDDLGVERGYDAIVCMPKYRYAENYSKMKALFRTGLPPKYSFIEDYITSTNNWPEMDILMVLCCINMLSESGKAYIIYPKLSLDGIKKQTEHLKKYLLERNYLETVIELPENIFSPGTGKYVVLILSRKNDKVQLVDASNYYADERKGRAKFTEKDIKEILDACCNETARSAAVSTEELLAKNAEIMPSRVLFNRMKLDMTTKPFTEFTDEIVRGVVIDQQEIMKYRATEETGYKLLRVADIEELSGFISDSAMNIAVNEEEMTKSIVPAGSVVISRVGNPFRITVIEDDAVKYIVSSNFYIIKLKSGSADPYFVKAYLESEQGQAELNVMAKGSSAMLTLGKKTLLEIDFPDIRIDEQRKIGKQYKRLLQKLYREKKTYNDMQQKVKKFWEMKE